MKGSGLNCNEKIQRNQEIFFIINNPFRQNIYYLIVMCCVLLWTMIIIKLYLQLFIALNKTLKPL